MSEHSSDLSHTHTGAGALDVSWQAGCRAELHKSFIQNRQSLKISFQNRFQASQLTFSELGALELALSSDQRIEQ